MVVLVGGSSSRWGSLYFKAQPHVNQISFCVFPLWFPINLCFDLGPFFSTYAEGIRVAITLHGGANQIVYWLEYCTRIIQIWAFKPQEDGNLILLRWPSYQVAIRLCIRSGWQSYQVAVRLCIRSGWQSDCIEVDARFHSDFFPFGSQLTFVLIWDHFSPLMQRGLGWQ